MEKPALKTSADRRQEVVAIIEALTHVLGNTSQLAQTTRYSAWNVRGNGATEAYRLFNSQSAELTSSQNGLGRRISFLNGVAVPTTDDSLVLRPPTELSFAGRKPEELAVLLSGGHEMTIMSIEAAVDVAREIDDYATRLILEMRLLAHSDHVVALRRILSG